MLKRCKSCDSLFNGNDIYCSGGCRGKKFQKWTPKNKKRKDRKPRIKKDTSELEAIVKDLRNQIKVLKNEISCLKGGKPNSFYNSQEWRELRYKVIRASNRTCSCCKATNVELHVDHIKPRSKYPHLELEITNLQVLCKDCNLGKGNSDEIKW